MSPRNQIFVLVFLLSFLAVFFQNVMAQTGQDLIDVVRNGDTARFVSI